MQIANERKSLNMIKKAENKASITVLIELIYPARLKMGGEQ